MDCQVKLNQETVVYHAMVGLTLALTFGVIVVRKHCARERMVEPGFRVRFYRAMGALKMLFVVILVLLIPNCPSLCQCQIDFSSFYLFPFIATLVGFKWFSDAAAAQREVNAAQHEANEQVVAVHLGGLDDGDIEVAEGTHMAPALTKPDGTKCEYKDIPIIHAESS